MKITIFGLTISSSWGNGHATPYRALIRALDQLGHTVRFYEKDVPYYANHRDRFHLPYCELVLYLNWEIIRQDAVTHAAESDVVIVASYCPDGARIADEMLALAGPMKVFYDLDTPITFAKFAADGKADYLHPRQIPEFDLVLSFTGGMALWRLEREFGAHVARALYGCVDPDEYRRVNANHPGLVCDLSYMGTYAADRQEKLETMFLEPARQSQEKQFLLAGSLYPWNWEWPANVRKLDHVAPTHHPELYSSSRMTLNITRRGMADSGYCPSGRFFEAAACECPILTDTWEGLDTFFSSEEILAVDSAGTVLEALRMDDQKLREIARRARQRTLDEHTGMHRAKELLGYLEEASAKIVQAESEAA